MYQDATASDKDLVKLIGKGLSIPDPKILSDKALWKKVIQPSSLDLRLGSKAWQMEGSIRPMRDETIELMVRGRSIKELHLSEKGTEFLRDRTYIVVLQETVHDLPAGAQIRSNPKSSTGRLDSLARLLADCNQQYESLHGHYAGRLYLEVSPNSFGLVLRRGDALNQIRYSLGNPIMPDKEILSVLRVKPLLYTKEGHPSKAGQVTVDNGIVLTADLNGEHTDSTIVAYRAKKDCLPPVDFRGIGKHLLYEYFDAIERPKGKELRLESDYFYLLSTNEAVSIPPAFAVELSQFDSRAGNITWHYAGFIDPGFGYFPGQEQQGNTVTLEVRAHNRAEIIRHGQPIGVMKMERMSSDPLLIYGAPERSSNYTRQIGVRYGKHFRE